MNLNNDVVYRGLRLGPLHQLYPCRSRSLIRCHNRLHKSPQAPVARLGRHACLSNASGPFVFAATIRQFQLRFAASARKKSFGSASPVFAVYKARSEQPFFVVWGPWMVPGLECKKSPEPYVLFSLVKSPSKTQSTSAAFLCKCAGMNAPGSIRICIIDGPSA